MYYQNESYCDDIKFSYRDIRTDALESSQTMYVS